MFKAANIKVLSTNSMHKCQQSHLSQSAACQCLSPCWILWWPVKMLPTYSSISTFQTGVHPPCWIFKIQNFNGRQSWGSTCITVPNFVAIGQTVAEIWRFLSFFQNADHLLSWICHTCVWTTHEEYLVAIWTEVVMIPFRTETPGNHCHYY